MPERNNLRPFGPDTYIYSDTTGYTATTIVNRLNGLGTYKYISSLNNAGSFIPGVFRLNPVVIKSCLGSGTPGYYHVSGTGLGYPKMYWDYTGFYISGGISNRYPSWTIPYGTWNTNLASYSLNKANAKFNSGYADVGIMLGELRETLAMIRHPLKELSALLSTIKNPKKLNSVGALDYLANQFLMIKFGVLPLISDIEKLRVAYDKLSEEIISHILSKRGSVQTSTASTDSWEYVSNITCKISATTKTEVKSTSIVYFQVVLEDIARRRAKYFGYDLSQMPSTIYQLIHYSFVVDWWIDLGSWIKAISPASHAQLLGGCTSQVSKVTTSYTTSNARIDNASLRTGSVIGQLPSITLVTETLDRRIDTSTLALPAFNPNSLDFGKLASLVAMIWQRTPTHWRTK